MLSPEPQSFARWSLRSRMNPSGGQAVLRDLRCAPCTTTAHAREERLHKRTDRLTGSLRAVRSVPGVHRPVSDAPSVN
jgi:hypothetical protein